MEKVICPKCKMETLASLSFCRNCKEKLPKGLKPISEKESEAEMESEKSAEGWLIAAGIFAVLGGLLGIFIGFNIYNSKIKLKSGVSVYKYKKEHRKIGLLIGLIAIASTILWRVLMPV